MKLFGPVLFYDLVRGARRGRLILVRCLYVLLLLAGLGLALLAVQPRFTYLSQNRGGFSASMLAELAEMFFALFMGIQYVAVVLLTPTLVASAVAEEKQRQTLDFLFTTDLRNREIILGKFGSRLCSAIMLLLAGFPVLALVQLFGGVDPLLLTAGYTVTLMTQVSVACLTLYFSVQARRVREALLKSYLAMLAYFGVWGVLEIFHAIVLLDHSVGSAPQTLMRAIIGWWNIGNPLYLLIAIVEFVRARGPAALPRLLEQAGWYAGFHLFVAAFFLWRSIATVRRVYIRQTYDPKPKKKLKGWATVSVGAAARKLWAPRKPLQEKPRKARWKPPMDDRPMRWKERHVEKGLRFNLLVQTLYVLLLFGLLAPGMVMAGVLLFSWWQGTDSSNMAEGFNGYFRFLAVVFTIVLLAMVGLRAAGSVGSEKDRQTWDGLLASPLTIREILKAKGWGSLWGARRLLGLLFTLCLLGVLCQGLSLPGGLAAAASFAAIAIFAAGLGLWCAARAKNSMRAVFSYLFFIILFCIVPTLMQQALVIANVLLDGLFFGQRGRDWVDPSNRDWFESLAFFSPVQCVFFAPSATDQSFLSFRPPWSRHEEGDLLSRVALFLAALGFYVLGGAGLWTLAYKRLWRDCGRVDSFRPKGEAILRPAVVRPAAEAGKAKETAAS